MFKKNLSLSVSMTPKPTTSDDPAAEKQSASDLAEIAMYHANHVARLVGTVYIGKKVIDTACKIAIIAAKNRL